MESDSEEEIFWGAGAWRREARCRLRLPRRTLDVASEDTSDSSVELIEAQSEPELPSGRRSTSTSPRPSPSPLPGLADDLDTTLDRIDAILRSGGARGKQHSPPSSATGQAFNKATIRTPTLKSPAAAMLMKAPRLPRQVTPRRPDAQSPFENIASPVAYYINNSPQVPLFRTVRPSRPLCAQLSAIPKPVSEPTLRAKGKENFVLPPKAYKYAKETKLIEMPAQKHLPRNKQVKKMASALPQPLVMRHERRERCGAGAGAGAAAGAPLARPDDSFADLSLAQADLSVCVVNAATTTHTLKPK